MLICLTGDVSEAYQPGHLLQHSATYDSVANVACVRRAHTIAQRGHHLWLRKHNETLNERWRSTLKGNMLVQMYCSIRGKLLRKVKAAMKKEAGK